MGNALHLNCQTTYLSLAHFKCAKNTNISLQMSKIIQYKAYLISNMLNILEILQNTVLKVNNRMVMGLYFFTIIKSKNKLNYHKPGTVYSK